MRKIALNASLGNFSAFLSRKSNKSFRAVAKKVWARDNYTCQFCSFQAREYQEVINYDGNYKNNKPSNMLTACCFCAQCNFLDSLGESGYGGGTVIYMPEITQNEISGMCHVLFCAMANDTTYKESAQSIYRLLRMRSQVVDEKLGEGVSNPAVLGQLIIDYRANEGKEPTELLDNLRLLPARGRFTKQIERWAAAALDEME